MAIDIKNKFHATKNRFGWLAISLASGSLALLLAMPILTHAQNAVQNAGQSDGQSGGQNKSRNFANAPAGDNQPAANAVTGDNQPAPAPQQLQQKLAVTFGNVFNPARHNFVPPFNHRTALFFGTPKVGNPYVIEGQEFRPFFPKSDYIETGMASWYGDDFHGKPTANGSQFNMELVSAAHRTLPLPAVAVVVNLRTGQSIKLIINDRGPFAKDRIIDLSKQAAHLIGYYGAGTTPVKVIFLRQETIALWKTMGQRKRSAPRQ